MDRTELMENQIEGSHQHGVQPSLIADVIPMETYCGVNGGRGVMDTSPSLTDLPEEILEHILSFLSPYKDMDTAKLVSKQWHRVIQSVIKQCRRCFYQQLSSCQLKWMQVLKDNSRVTQAGHPERTHLSISDRFSHCATYLNNSMYVFGGCTSTNTTFNDLWRFDLTLRKWIRPVAMGTYPSPKACATMVVYNGTLVLFGGWSHPIPYPLHQSAHYFSELHVYNPVSNRWSHVLSIGLEPDSLGGHSASVAGHLMVVFGGSPRPGLGTNKLWVFSFLKGSWSCPQVTGAGPEPRYGQFQTTLDERHILIMGGCVGQNKVYNDIYVLTVNSEGPWEWTKIDILHPELAAPQTWCHAACKVKDMVVVVAKSSKVREAKNVKPRVYRAEPENEKKTAAVPRPSSGQGEPNQYQRQHNFEDSSPEERNEDAAHASDRHMDHHASDEAGNAAEKGQLPATNNSNLLALQQRLHRDCASLPDPDNHHHNPHRASEAEEPEGILHRLSNRHRPQDAEGVVQEQQHHHHHYQLPVQQNRLNQPHAGHLQRLPHNPPPSAVRGGMPSVRPNAMFNRQRQLEALQRQEEILRSKSRALAAARNKPRSEDGANFSVEEELVPEIIVTKNKMDVHVVDISRVLTDGIAEWKPLSSLQPPGAPTETICCSLLEGRGELILFGGVVREMSSPVATNVAISKLYLLHPK